MQVNGKRYTVESTKDGRVKTEVTCRPMRLPGFGLCATSEVVYATTPEELREKVKAVLAKWG